MENEHWVGRKYAAIQRFNILKEEKLACTNFRDKNFRENLFLSFRKVFPKVRIFRNSSQIYLYGKYITVTIYYNHTQFGETKMPNRKIKIIKLSCGF